MSTKDHWNKHLHLEDLGKGREGTLSDLIERLSRQNAKRVPRKGHTTKSTKCLTCWGAANASDRQCPEGVLRKR